MRKMISVMILMIGLLLLLPESKPLQASNVSDPVSLTENKSVTATGLMEPEEGEGNMPNEKEQPGIEKESAGNFFAENWGVLILGLLGFFDLIARLTPTERDNSIVNLLLTIFNVAIPNLKKGGGSFKLLSK